MVGVGKKDSGLRLLPEWRLSVSATKPIPAALSNCHPWRLDSRVQAGMTAPGIFLPHGMAAPRARLTDCGRSGWGASGDLNEHRRVGEIAIRGVWILVSKQELRIGLFCRPDRHRRTGRRARNLPTRNARGTVPATPAVPHPQRPQAVKRAQRLFSSAPLLQWPCRRNMDNTPKTPKKVAFL